MLLVLAALDHRERVSDGDRHLVPVPVMFNLNGWDPSRQRVEDWLAGRLQQDHRLFAGRGGIVKAVSLVRAGRIAVFLDGLDEIPEKLRPVALQALSQQVTFRVIILTRSAEMAAAASQSHLEGAAALELQDIEPAAAAGYLTRIQIAPAPRGWFELTDRLRRAPDSPIAQALSSPLTLTLVRDIYRSADNLRELLDFCDASDHGVSREEIIDYLLDRVLPAAYERRPGARPLRYDLQDAQEALCYIAARMNKDGSRDLAWWHVPAWTSRPPRIIATGLAVGFLATLVAGFWFGWLPFLIAFVVVLLNWREGAPPNRMNPPQWGQLFTRSSLEMGFRQGYRQSLVSGLGFGLLAGFALWKWEGAASAGWFVVGFAPAFVVAFWDLYVVLYVAGFMLGWPGGALSEPRADNPSAFSPLASWRRDRAVALGVGLRVLLGVTFVIGLGAGLGLGTGLGLAFVFGMALGPETPGTAFEFWLMFGLGPGLVAGLVAGLVSGLRYCATWPTSLAFAQLAMLRRSPVRLMQLLEDAHERNVLRTVGPVYQFRHARLQDRLAYQASPCRASCSDQEHRR